ncbi:MAG: hypothetical protein IT254_07100 [Chitinophagaceae bacterium]|nr:hypothetical protein [Chitinophagaceae bacterium]
MKLGINFSQVAQKAAGHAIGAAAFTQLNKVKFMQDMGNDPKKQVTKGLIVAAAGYIVGPMLGKQFKLTGGKKGLLIESAFEGMGMIGTMIAANALMPAKDGKPSFFPTISGYEESPINGYELSPLSGLGELDDESLEGLGDESLEGLGELDDDYEVSGQDSETLNISAD